MINYFIPFLFTVLFVVSASAQEASAFTWHNPLSSVNKIEQHLRNKRPQAKILLTQHTGYSHGEVDSSRKEVYESLNRWTG